MNDDLELLDFAKHNRHLESLVGKAAKETGKPAAEGEEESCLAFGFLRGIRERALAVEFRLNNGNREWFPYSCLVSWRFDPSTGLLLKFTADVVSLVLIRGSNLDAFVNATVNLPHGFQRHRIVWVREMDKAEIHKVGKGEPTIDRIEVGEFESPEELREWLSKAAPVFARRGTS
jgi:hypothetical protein